LRGIKVSRLKKIILIILIVFACAGCDQSTKYVASHNLDRNETSSYFYDTFRLQYAENKGAFLGLGNNLSEETRFILFSVIVSIVLGSLLTYMILSKKLSTYSITSLSLVLSGGLSNLYDRILNDGSVVDFLNLGIGSLRTGIFNFADVFIMVGFFMLILVKDKTSNTERHDL